MKVLITGGTNGMGKGVAKALASCDNQAHEIIILCRSKELGEAVTQELVRTTSNKQISIIVCDLAKLTDVKRAIIEIQEKHAYLDGIFINAGLGYASKPVETEDGFDSHFQVNYLSQFMLTLNLLNLLKNSSKGGRIIFNATKKGAIYWDNMQLKEKWSYEKAIFQAMVAKRMFLNKLHQLHSTDKTYQLSFIGFQIPKTVWSNQLNIIPSYMRIMAKMMKIFGTFISIERCGEIMAPLFTEDQSESLKKSGKLITMKRNHFLEINEKADVLNHVLQNRLWHISLDLCADEKTHAVAFNVLV